MKSHLRTVVVAMRALMRHRLPAMTRGQRRAVLLLATGLLAHPSLALALDIFDFSVTRFEAQGNSFGAGFVDDFSSGSLSPYWGLAMGTAEMTGGVLHLKNPGTPDASVKPGITFNRSDVYNVINVLKGSGNFTASSTWARPVPLDENAYIMLYLASYQNPDNIEASVVGLSNLSPAAAALMGQTTYVEPSIFQGYFHKVNGAWLPGDGSNIHIDPSAITGPVEFRLAYNDTTKLVTASASLDGGLTFQTLSKQFPAFTDVSYAVFQIDADPVTVTATPPRTSSVPAVPRWGLLALMGAFLGAFAWLAARSAGDAA